MGFDLGLKFGNTIVSIETKSGSGTILDFNYLVETLIGQARGRLNNPNIDKAVVTIFYNGEIPESFNCVRIFEDGKIFIVAIKTELESLI